MRRPAPRSGRARRRAIAAALLLVLSGASCARATAPADQEREVTAALDAFYSALGRGDTAAAMDAIAPDAMFVESGRLETRAEYEANHLPADIGFERQVQGKRTIQRVTVQGDTAWVIATTDYDGTFDGSPVNFVGAQLAVLGREDGRWRIRSVHWSSRRP